MIDLNRGAGTQACNCKGDRLWVRFSLEEIKYFMFIFPRSGVEGNGSVEFRQSTHNARIRRKKHTMCNKKILATATMSGILT